LQPDERMKNEGTPASIPSPWMLVKVSETYTVLEYT
jgi:hypothetical protein